MKPKQTYWGNHTGPRRGTMQSVWTKGPKSQRRLLLYELQRSNDIDLACAYAGITHDLFDEWRYTGFLSPLQLEKAYDFYAAHHPEVPQETPQVNETPMPTKVEMAVDVTPAWVWRVGNVALQHHLIGYYYNRAKAGETIERVENEYEQMHLDDWLESEEYQHRVRMKLYGVDVMDMDDG